MSKSIYLVLDNIRSAENVGSIFRTADAAGVKKIFLLGITPRPVDKFSRVSSRIAKAALGAEKNIEWVYHETATKLFKTLKESGINIVALEQHPRAISYRKYKVIAPTALVVGNEVDGVTKTILKQADAIIEIPMAGQKESLNVSVAAGIALFELAR